MQERLRWWVLPAAMIVLLRVVTLGERAAERPAAPADAVEASGSGAMVAILDAAGQRTPPLVVPRPGDRAFVVAVPQGHVGERGTLTVWRRVSGAREATPWLTLTPRVTIAATVPIAGLAAGRYDVELRLGERLFAAVDAAAPGTAELAAMPPR